jgi:hypothetical protein
MESSNQYRLGSRKALFIFALFILVGFVTFIFGVAGHHPERAWQAYLINFLLWSAIAQGGLLFSTVTHITKARWSKPLQGLSESFAAFFPFSFVLFLLLFLGKDHVFPWLHQDLHGKEVWLNMPFLFSRDIIGLLILYGLGLAYLYYALRLKINETQPQGSIAAFLHRWWSGDNRDEQWCKSRMSVLGVLYIVAYALVLSLIGFDLVMSMDPHWISTLFGAYSFVKAFYIGLGGLIILASIICLRHGDHCVLSPSHFHDIGKLFFAFCLLWADLFYCQLVVIWYANISEETNYLIERTMVLPWKYLSWTVFAVCFVVPFLILLNRRVKTKPNVMVVLCSIVVVGIWFEHLLLLGPSLSPHMTHLPLSMTDGLISLGFLGLMAMAVTFLLNLFPELVPLKAKGEV